MSRIIGQSSSSQQSVLTALGKQLLVAAEDGNDKEIQSLLLQGASFTANWLGMSPLHYACMNGHLESARLLTRAGVSWDGRTKVDKTPMHFAAQFGHHDVVAMLISFGADINAKDMLEMTSLHWAVVEQHFDIVKLLIDNNAIVTTKNKFDKSLMDSAEDTCDFRIIEYLKTYTGESGTYQDSATTSSQEPSPESNTYQNLTDQLSWLQQELLNHNNSGGASVLLEGANAITLTEGGKLAWAQVFEQDRSAKENEKNLEIVLPTQIQENGQKIVSLKLPNHMIPAAPSDSEANNQAVTIVVSPNKTKQGLKSPPSKRRKASTETCDLFTTDYDVSKEELLQRQLVAAQTQAQIYREKLLRKEQEANLWKQQLERLQQNRR
uniref:GA-binding protein subunit beta-1-like n=1 Tax=Phallusia mammillata TaxID=59560 RepID=A0A6F9DE48_9ASCI|nr:GA-binding protein subunit beta-1-like [Phallusia mammillata]